MKKIYKDQRGLSNVLMVLLALVVLGGIGFAAYKVMNKDGTSSSALPGVSKSELKAAEKACNDAYKDKDLCKFMAGWNAKKSYQVAITGGAGDQEGTMTMTVDGENSASNMLGMEIVTVDGVTYTKAGDTWYYQKKAATTPAETETTTPVSEDTFDFEAPKEGEEAKFTFERVGEEACGSLKCIKYTGTETGVEGEYSIWIDTKDHLLRKMESIGTDGAKMTMAFSYDNVSVKVPTPNKELAENQYILPGSTEPQTMPSASDFGL